MGSGRSSGAGIVLCLTIVGFIVSLFFFWPLAFAILFLGLAIFCALESSSKRPSPRIPQGRRPRRYELTTRPQRPPPETPPRPYYPETYPKPESTTPSPYRIRIPVEEGETETEGVYRWEIEEEPEVSTSTPELEEEPEYSLVEVEDKLDELEAELEETRSRYMPVTREAEEAEKTVKEILPEEETLILEEKAERLKDLESEEEATKIILEELKNRWMKGKLDLDMYQRLKEKYEKKIEEIQKQKKQLPKE